MTTTSGDESGSPWSERDHERVWHAMSGHDRKAPTMVVAEADGAWITDVYGNRYLDGMAGQWCVNAGYGREELARAAYDQLVAMPFYPLVQGHKPVIELSEKLNDWLGGDYVFFYTNSGSEANETAFKVARQYHDQNGEPGRWKFVSRYRAYHGSTGAALAATGHAGRKHRYEPLSPGFIHVAPPDRYRCAYCADRPGCNLQCAGEVGRVIDWELAETVAGVVMEPMITGGGMILAPDGYVERVAETCEKTGALLIIDEVICGFGRTGKRFGFQHHDVQPDIVTMAKGITSGYQPLGATAVRREVFEKFGEEDEYGRLRHISTFGGHPAACAVAVKNMEILEREDLVGRAAEVGLGLCERLRKLEGIPGVGEVRGRGMIYGIELVEDKGSKKPAGAARVNEVVAGCKERGLIVGKTFDTAPGFDNVLTLCPPLNVTEADVDFMVGVLEESLSEGADAGRPQRPPTA